MLKNNMRLKAIILIVTLSLSIFAPVSFALNISDNGKISVITTLDVCHAKGSLASASDMPVINETQCSVCEFCSVAAHNISNFHFKDIPVIFQKERPPRF
jgi:hypothetical protein